MSRILYYVLVPLMLMAVACDQPDRSVRQYREVSFAEDPQPAQAPVAMPTPPAEMPASGSARMPDLPPEMRAPSLPLEWDTPEGWESLGGSGMRIATLMIEGQECTILSFPGDVGGDEANIRRWVGLINQSVPNDQLKAFVANPLNIATKGGFEARLFDFADMLPPGAPIGTLVGIIPVGDQTAFVKLTGEAAILARHKESFEQLCRSIRLRPESL